MAENEKATTSPPRQPDLTPPPFPATPVPSATLYAAILLFALFLIWLGFASTSERWASFWLNLGCNFLALVAILLVIEQRIRPNDMRRVRGFTSSMTQKTVLLVWPEARDVVGYARSIADRLGELAPGWYMELPSLNEAITKHRNGFVLLGMAGSGKTTFLQTMALRQAKEAIKNPFKARIPIVLSLHNWAPDRRLEDYLRQVVQQFYQMSDRRFDTLLRNGRFMLLCDGYDDMRAEYRPEFLKQFLELREHIPNGTVILSSRSVSIPTDTNLPVVNITPQEAVAM